MVVMLCCVELVVAFEVIDYLVALFGEVDAPGDEGNSPLNEDEPGDRLRNENRKRF